MAGEEDLGPILEGMSTARAARPCPLALPGMPHGLITLLSYYMALVRERQSLRRIQARPSSPTLKRVQAAGSGIVTGVGLKATLSNSKE